MSTLTREEWLDRRWSIKKSTGNHCHFAEYDDGYDKVTVFLRDGRWKAVINIDGRDPIWGTKTYATAEEAKAAVADVLVKEKLLSFSKPVVKMCDLSNLEIRRIIKLNHPDTSDDCDLALYQRAVEELDRRRRS